MLIGQIPMDFDHAIGRASGECSYEDSIRRLDLNCVRPVHLGQLGMENRSAGVEFGIKGIELTNIAGKERHNWAFDLSSLRRVFESMTSAAV